MKSVFTAVLLWITAVWAQQWVSQNPFPTAANLSDIAVAGNTICAVGEAGVVVTSGDGGVTWSEHRVDARFELMAVAFGDPLHGWCCGVDADQPEPRERAVWRTSDGGESWSRVQELDGAGARDVCFVDALHGWVVGDQRYRTTDGGESWLESPEVPGHVSAAVSFANAEHGWAVGALGSTLHTDDGGANWDLQQCLCDLNLLDVIALDELNVYALSDDMLFITHDGGVNWYPRPVAYSSRKVMFTDPQRGFVTRWQDPPQRTTDGGDNWSQLPADSAECLRALAQTGSQALWGVGDAGLIAVSTDDGGLWARRSSGMNGDLGDIEFSDLQFGLAVGSAGGVRTTDGGLHWNPLVINTARALRQVEIANSHIAFILDDSDRVWKSTNAGLDWEAVAYINTADARVDELHCIDSLYAWLGGVETTGWTRTSYLYRTTNGGTAWQQMFHNANWDEGITGISFYNRQHGYASTMEGYILDTHDGGMSWHADDGNGYVRDVRALSDSVAVAATSDGLMRTVDGGQTWWFAYYLDPSYWVIDFSDSLHGMALRADSTFATTDGGVTWDWIAQLPVPPYLSALTMIDPRHAWACGGNGRIIAYSGPASAAPSMNTPLVPAQMSMTGFPNPFNSETTLKFVVTKSDRTALRVFDIAGREVANLLDAALPAGERTVRFDGAQLPSGIYFAQLQSAGTTVTRKLLLIK